MKNNRQIGLNGRVFVSGCLKRGTVFVFVLMIGAALTAVADIMKLTGQSGALMGSFTTTLLLYDFICSLLLVVTLFYAYFLECGDSVPVIRDKPLIVFGCVRLGYLILLMYYICYRALYCLCFSDRVSPALCVFYFIYLIFIVLCILANSFLYNILTRNIIRRSYMKSFHALSTVGVIVQILLPISYIVARVTMKDIGDEYFTTSICDLIRLCICPICTVSVWFMFVNSINQVSDVFSEVDSALREKRYQITYTAPENTDDSDDKKKAKSYSETAFLPAPSAARSIDSAPSQKALPPVSHQAEPSVAKPNAAAKPGSKPVKKYPPKQPSAPIPTPAPSAQPRVNAPVGTPSVPAAPSIPTAPPAAPAVPLVQEFNPYPSDSVPLNHPANHGNPRPNAPKPPVGSQGKKQPVNVKRSQPQQGARRPNNGQNSKRDTRH